MIDRGATLQVADVDGWYDAGQLGTLLDTNRVMLERGRAQRPDALGPGVTVIEPVRIEAGCTIEHSTVGPNVTLGAGSVVRHSTLAHSIVGAGARLERAQLHDSFLGDQVTVHDARGAMSLADHTEIRGDA
jgi:glucose-1-phosphate thymidylyltransferase